VQARTSPDKRQGCSIGRTLEVVGEKWTILVLREAFYGVRRFADFHDNLGCARNILSARLATLVQHGVLHRHPYREPGARERVEYRLTHKGLDLFPALIALMQWGDRWAAPFGPPVEIHHRDCDALVHVTMECEASHRSLTARDVSPVPGPGAVP